jgi:hypothetical protein
MARGTPLRFRIVMTPDVTSGGQEMPYREIMIDSPALAAALILYCRDRRIPLSATADKSLQQCGNQIPVYVLLSAIFRIIVTIFMGKRRPV